jgi:serine/threonine protein kinase
MQIDELNGLTLGDKFQLGAKIGNGSFGEIYLAKNVKTLEDLAVKIEAVQAEIESSDGKAEQKTSQRFRSQLKREAKIYHKLEGEGKSRSIDFKFVFKCKISIAGIPKVRWLGLGEHSNYMVMDLLGRSLEDLFNYCDRKFSLKTVLVLSYELINRIETIHNRGKLVHRDIKPENFLMGRGRDRHTVYVIDFGLAKLYQNPKTGRHIPIKEGYSLTGTARYASVNAHHGRGKHFIPT